jgi:hypothetical protein
MPYMFAVTSNLFTVIKTLEYLPDISILETLDELPSSRKEASAQRAVSDDADAQLPEIDKKSKKDNIY